MEATNLMATNRQLFALWLASGKSHDYRNDGLTRVQASSMLEEFNAKSGYRKESPKTKTEPEPKTLEKELEEYLVLHFEEFFDDCAKSMKQKSIVEMESGGKTQRYAFIGCGCSISYFTYRKNNKKAEALAKTANRLMEGKIMQMFLNKFTRNERAYYTAIGCPLEAIYSQDYGINNKLYSLVVRFANERGINMDYKTVLD